MDQHGSTLSELTVADCEDNFDAWADRPFVRRENADRIRNSQILVVPIERYGERDLRAFPVRTEELFLFLRKGAPSGVAVDICIEEDDYREMALHSDLLSVGCFVVTTVFLPVLVDLISEYVRKKLPKRDHDRDIKTSITVVNASGQAKRLTYEGKCEDLERVITESKRLFDEQENGPNSQLLEDN